MKAVAGQRLAGFQLRPAGFAPDRQTFEHKGCGQQCDEENGKEEFCSTT